MATRSVDATGLVWQQGPHGEKIVGEVHRTKAGRFYVVMLGRRLSPGSVATFAEAREAALAYEPSGDDVQVMATILDPTSSWAVSA